MSNKNDFNFDDFLKFQTMKKYGGGCLSLVISVVAAVALIVFIAS